MPPALDLIVELNDGEICVSAAVLRLASEVFDAMLAADMREARTQRIRVGNGVTVQQFQQFYECLLPFPAVLQAEAFVVDDESVDSLLLLSDYYQVECLRRDCESLLLTLEPSVARLLQARDFCLVQQYDRCADAIAAHPQRFDLEQLRGHDEVLFDVARRMQVRISELSGASGYRTVAPSEKRGCGWCSCWRRDSDEHATCTRVTYSSDLPVHRTST